MRTRWEDFFRRCRQHPGTTLSTENILQAIDFWKHYPVWLSQSCLVNAMAEGREDTIAVLSTSGKTVTPSKVMRDKVRPARQLHLHTDDVGQGVTVLRILIAGLETVTVADACEGHIQVHEAIVQSAHKDVANALCHELERRGMDGSALIRSGEVCREVCSQLAQIDVIILAEQGPWPECFALRVNSLHQLDINAVVQADRSLTQLRAQLDLEARTTSPPPPPPPAPVVVSLSPPRVTVEGVAYPVNDVAARLVQALVEKGDWLAGSSVVNQPSRVVAGMPPEVRRLIESVSGKGTRLKPRAE